MGCKFLHASKGFTLIELLIVIVIIGILAAITIVAFNGVQARAYNSQITTGVTEFRNALEAYKAVYGFYPQTTREINGQSIATVCLGTGYAGGYCGVVSGTSTYVDTAFNTELAKVSSGGAISSTNLPSGSESFTGAVYGIDVVDSSQSPTGYARTIQYALDGANTNCQIPGAWAYRSQSSPASTACEIILETVPAR